jgi:hypothetical protein
MLKKLLVVVKKIVIAGFSLFAFNLMIMPLNLNVPINVVTILFTALFGLAALPFFTILLAFFF